MSKWPDPLAARGDIDSVQVAQDYQVLRAYSWLTGWNSLAIDAVDDEIVRICEWLKGITVTNG